MNSATGSESDSPESTPTFFRSFIFSPEVPIRLDYQGKRVDMEQVGTFSAANLNLCSTLLVLDVFGIKIYLAGCTEKLRFSYKCLFDVKWKRGGNCYIDL